MDITNYRNEIDTIDQELVEILDKRMRVAEKIAAYKAENGKQIVDPLREQEHLDKITEQSAEDMAYYNRILFSSLMEMSSEHQRNITGTDSEISKTIRTAIDHTAQQFPKRATVACAGVRGAYAQEATEKFFQVPSIMYTKNFRGVFAAVESGLCQYGVLPIENSTAGSVNQVYDLMREYDFHIVKSIKIKVSHSLLVNAGTNKADIKEIISHEQALTQCDEYLKREFPNAEITVCENTALAARTVAESGRKDVAALASPQSGKLYSLVALDESVQDHDNNYTRFICLAKDLEIYPGANKTSFMCVTNHKPGSLYRVLARFNASGINILKLESRPIPDSDFDFMFYFDIDASVYSEEFVSMMSQLDATCKVFKYYGSYTEI